MSGKRRKCGSIHKHADKKILRFQVITKTRLDLHVALKTNVVN